MRHSFTPGLLISIATISRYNIAVFPVIDDLSSHKRQRAESRHTITRIASIDAELAGIDRTMPISRGEYSLGSQPVAYAYMLTA